MISKHITKKIKFFLIIAEICYLSLCNAMDKPLQFLIDFKGHSQGNVHKNCSFLQKLCFTKISPEFTGRVELAHYFSGLQQIPSLGIDQSYLENATSIIVHASYQGITSALEYITNRSHNAQPIAALILTNPMLSDNNALCHNLFPEKNNYIASIMVPIIIKHFLCIKTKKQPADLLEKLAKEQKKNNMPIVIVHYDNTFPLKDAQSIYAFLKREGCRNIFFHNTNALDDSNIKVNSFLNYFDCNHIFNTGKEAQNPKYQPRPKSDWNFHLVTTQRQEIQRWYFNKLLELLKKQHPLCYLCVHYYFIKLMLCKFKK